MTFCIFILCPGKAGMKLCGIGSVHSWRTSGKNKSMRMRTVI